MALGSSEAHSFTETYVLLSQGPLREEKEDKALISLFYQHMFEPLLYTRNTL